MTAEIHKPIYGFLSFPLNNEAAATLNPFSFLRTPCDEGEGEGVDVLEG
jgi:hypothetical protein